MSKHKKIERKREIDRKRKRRAESLKMRKRELLKQKPPVSSAKKAK